MKRLFYTQLLDWKNGGLSKPLMVLGARQVGKTYLVDEFCKAEFKHYKQINLFEEPLLKQIYESDLSSERKFEQLRLLAEVNLDNPETVLFVDEVQESEEFIAELKFLQEKHPEANIVCAGSLLGVKLKRLNRPFPVGKITIKNMYPLSFPEFLTAFGKEDYLPVIEQCFQENVMMISALHEELLQMLRVFLCVGGMPEIVQALLDNGGNLLTLSSSFFDDLQVACLDDMRRHIRNLNEAIKIERIYNSIPTQLANKSSKFQYSKIRSGARASTYETALDWLISADLVYKANCVTTPEKPIRYFTDQDIYKLFLNDTGILVHSLGVEYRDIVLNRLSSFKGLLAESYVANELVTAGLDLYYWRSDSNSEVDFLIETDDGVIPIEVKSADNVQSKSLNTYRTKYNPAYAIRVSTKNYGFENGIKSIPLYAAFCLSNLI